MVMLIALLLGLPVVVAIVVSALPEGRAAMIGTGVALAVAVLGWFMAAGEPYLEAAAFMVLGAVALGGILQILRRRLPMPRPAWVYPAIVAVAIALVGLFAARILGM